MDILDVIKNAIISGTLVTGTPEPALMDTSPPQLFVGSEEMQRAMAPIKNGFLKAAGHDVLVYTTADLILPHERDMLRPTRSGTQVPLHDVIPEAHGIARMKIFQAPLKDILPYRLRDVSYAPDDKRLFISDTLLWSHLKSAAEEGAFASTYRNSNNGRKFCIVLAPPPESSETENFLWLANLPEHYHVRGIQAVPRGGFFTLSMSHEATHCNEDEYSKSGIAAHIERHDRENAADINAEHMIRPYFTAAASKALIEANRAARSIDALRSAGDFYEGISAYPIHATHVFKPGEKVDITFDNSDVMLSGLILSTMARDMASRYYTAALVQGGDEGLRTTLADRGAVSYRGNDEDGDAPITPEQDAEDIQYLTTVDHLKAGSYINQHYPSIEMGLYKAIHEKMAQEKPDKEMQPLVYRLHMIQNRMLENYFQAIEKYVPEIAGDDRVAEAYTRARTDMKPVNDMLSGIIPAAGNGIWTPQTTAVQVLGFFSALHERHILSGFHRQQAHHMAAIAP